LGFSHTFHTLISIVVKRWESAPPNAYTSLSRPSRNKTRRTNVTIGHCSVGNDRIKPRPNNGGIGPGRFLKACALEPATRRVDAFFSRQLGLRRGRWGPASRSDVFGRLMARDLAGSFPICPAEPGRSGPFGRTLRTFRSIICILAKTGPPFPSPNGRPFNPGSVSRSHMSPEHPSTNPARCRPCPRAAFYHFTNLARDS